MAGATKKSKAQAAIEWREWKDDTFEEAKERDKLILLDLSAVWCHWCHRMDADVYDDPAVIEFINAEMVPIRVDVDRDPDVADRYNQGGFPTTCFLTPQGEILYGGTYIPLGDFRPIMEQIAAYYKNAKDEVMLRIQDAKTQFINEIAFDSSAELQENYYEQYVKELSGTFDKLLGGFGSGQRFPFPEVLDFLFFEAKRSGNKDAATHARKTLESIRSGLFDKEEGGFFRYTVKEDWTEPHFEKILDENFLIISAFLSAIKHKPDEKFLEAVTRSFAYLKDAFWDEELGVFYASCSADEKYYALKGKARAEAERPAIDRTVFVNKNAVAASVLYKMAAHFRDESYADMAQRIVSFILAKCYSKRNGFSHYFSDGQAARPGLLTDQVHMIKALIDTYEYTGEARYLEFAEMTHAYIRGNLVAPKKGAFADVNLCVGREYCEEVFGRFSFINKPFFENSKLMYQLAKLGYITGNELYLADAQDIQKFFASLDNNFLQYGVIAHDYVLASKLLEEPRKVYPIGRVAQGEIRELLSKIYDHKNALTVIIPLDLRMNGAQISELALSEKPAPNTVVVVEKDGSKNVILPGSDDIQAALDKKEE